MLRVRNNFGKMNLSDLKKNKNLYLFDDFEVVKSTNSPYNAQHYEAHTLHAFIKHFQKLTYLRSQRWLPLMMMKMCQK